jgi:hypothetical protein
MTPARASGLRSQRTEGNELTSDEQRTKEQAQKMAEAGRYTIERLWQEYKLNRSPGKSLDTDEGRYKKYIKPIFGNRDQKISLSWMLTGKG